VVNIINHDEVVEPEIDGEKIKITVKEVRELYFEYQNVFDFIASIDNKDFTLTYSDYQELPAITIELLNLYKNEKSKLMLEKSKV
jgi:hypothetical protein